MDLIVRVATWIRDNDNPDRSRPVFRNIYPKSPQQAAAIATCLAIPDHAFASSPPAAWQETEVCFIAYADGQYGRHRFIIPVGAAMEVSEELAAAHDAYMTAKMGPKKPSFKGPLVPAAVAAHRDNGDDC